ncbi:hypothetical protein LBMAG53_27550 [Planctomycetota bacterium]|nr:hypothetical protein LBMAG53_27550 [Planctomycetota bacterium]
MNIVKLNLTLSDGSIRSVEEQSFPEWPEMNKIVYGQMQSEVGIMLPIMVEYLSQNLSLAKIEELKFLIIQAICTNVYVKWCYNKQETVRGYINNNDEIDFVAPKIYETIQIIRRVIEIKNNKQAMIQQGDAPEPAMNAVSSSQPSIPPSQ